MALYSKVEYWNERYLKSRNQTYEWYQNYNSLAHLMNPETLSGCSGTPITMKKAAANVNANAANANNNTDEDDTTANSNADDASVSTTAVTNATSAKAFQCLHPSNCRVLILGCGNSQFGSKLYEAGWRGGDSGRFVQVDFSPVVIEQMNERYNDKYYQSLAVAGGQGTHKQRGYNKKAAAASPSTSTKRMEFVCADVTLPPIGGFANGSFDLIICKGVFDAVLCSAGSVFNIRRMVKECVRLLNDDGGVLMVVTYGNPDNRVVFLEDEDGELETYWQGVSVHTVPSLVRSRNKHGGGHHHHHHNSNKNDYVYLCRKKRGAWKESYHHPSMAAATANATTMGSGHSVKKKTTGAGTENHHNQMGHQQHDLTVVNPPPLPPPKGNKESHHHHHHHGAKQHNI